MLELNYIIIQKYINYIADIKNIKFVCKLFLLKYMYYTIILYIYCKHKALSINGSINQSISQLIINLFQILGSI